MRAARLVQWCGLFGVSEGAARVALSRMLDRGELTARDGTYELAGRVRGRRAAQDWSLVPRLAPFDGRWRLALVEPAARDAADRSALRDAMRRLRMGELREGMWARPDNLPRASAPDDAWAVADAQCRWWTATPDGDPVALAAELFDPAGWTRTARRLHDRLERARGALDGSRERALADAFVAGTAAVAHVRADPLLPPALGPSNEAGDALRREYQAYEQAFSDALRAWFRRHA
jgi:phenylacetic acid degradation operon negative regulatory protein